MVDYHVVPSNGGWDAKQEGSKRASGHFDTQAKAEAAAKSFSRNSGGGEVVIHKPDGTIRDSDTVYPGKDPSPPRDKKH